MYGLGLSEIALIFLVLLLFFRPEEIFSFLRKAGQWYSRVSRVQKNMEDLINREFSTSDEKEKFGFDAENKNKDTESDNYKEIYKDEISEDFNDDKKRID